MVSIWKWSASIVCLVLVKSEGVTALGVGGRSYISTCGRGTCSRTSETFTTRMYSSRMRNVRCSSRLPAWGCLTAGGGCLSRGRGRCLPRRVSTCLGGGSACPEGCTPPSLWTEFLTHACENITFPQLRLRTVTNNLHCICHSLFFVST